MGHEPQRLEISLMARNGYGITEKVIVNFICRVVRDRNPESVGLLSTLGIEPLSDEQLEVFRRVLADELVEEGLGPDDEPNAHGLLVETAIDWLGRQ